ncbi:MAG: hypothetical protein GC190_21020 [Alphaproteobacteria bacterium]|nr:hypothetical protein [Alphaproteobacteria bacterium]
MPRRLPATVGQPEAAGFRGNNVHLQIVGTGGMFNGHRILFWDGKKKKMQGGFAVDPTSFFRR